VESISVFCETHVSPASVVRSIILPPAKNATSDDGMLMALIPLFVVLSMGSHWEEPLIDTSAKKRRGIILFLKAVKESTAIYAITNYPRHSPTHSLRWPTNTVWMWEERILLLCSHKNNEHGQELSELPLQS
jgi:hypothetical protein